MWMYTKHGAYSVVEHYSGEEMMVRTRHRQYLEDLMEAAEVSHEIVVTPDRDYEFRIVVSKAEWDVIGKYLLTSITYPDFKTHLNRSGFFDDSVEESYAIYTGAYNSYVKNSNSIYA